MHGALAGKDGNISNLVTKTNDVAFHISDIVLSLLTNKA
jgi:hypothetical protein